MHTETRTIQTEVVTQWVEEIKAIQKRVAQTSPYILGEKSKFVYTENYVESTYKLSELAADAEVINQKLLEFYLWLELALKTVVDTDSQLASELEGGNGGGGGGGQSVDTTTPEDLAKDKTKETDKSKEEEEAKKKAEEEAKKKAEEEEARKKQEEAEAKQKALEDEINKKNQESQQANDEFEQILKDSEDYNNQQQAEQDQNRTNWLNEEGNGQNSNQDYLNGDGTNNDSNNSNTDANADANKDQDSLGRQALENTTNKDSSTDSNSTDEDKSKEEGSATSGGGGSSSETDPLDATSSLQTLDELSELDETLKDAAEDGESLLGADKKELDFGSSRLSSGEKPIVTTGTTKGINPWAVAGFGLAATGIIVGTGLLIKNNACYTFSPEDWVVLSNPVKNTIINDFLKAGFTQNEIETFINSTFKIRVKEMDKYINDIKKANEVDASLEMEISDQYGFSIFDGDGRIIKYAVFVILVLDGVNVKDSFNLYNILNSSLDENSIDFSYNGINMMDYIEDQYYPNGESNYEEDEEEDDDDDDDDGLPKPYDGY